MKATTKPVEVELINDVRFVLDTFKNDIDKGYVTKDKEFAVAILSLALSRIDDIEPKGSEWISVDDKLPETDDEFLVCANGCVTSCSFNPWISSRLENYENSFHWFTWSDIPNYGSEKCEVMGVTHWMNFPKPPVTEG